MADRELKVIARRDDGAYLVEVVGAPCVLTLADDPDDGLGIWANDLDAAVARGNWQEHSGALPAALAQAAQAFVARPDWCPLGT